MRFELSGTTEIAAPTPAVWAKVIDHEFVAASAPGVESVEAIDAEHFRVIAGLGIGSIKLRFTLTVELSELIAPASLRIQVRGDAPGSAMRADGRISLTAVTSTSTRLDWTLASDVHGTIASIGARMLQGTVGKLTQGFWKKFAKRVVAAEKPIRDVERKKSHNALTRGSRR